MNVIYLGDSITDAGRSIGEGSMVSIGQGYALITSAKLSAQRPGAYNFINSAISGSRIVDIYARIKTDAWNKEPDVISILAGVNDVWHEFDMSNGVDAERFENVYRMLLTDTKKRFPNVKFLLMEPFVLRESATTENWEGFQRETLARAAVVKKLAEEFNTVFVPLQCIFDEACKQQSVAYWLADGVHPTPAGHQLIADAWMEAFGVL